VEEPFTKLPHPKTLGSVASCEVGFRGITLVRWLVQTQFDLADYQPLSKKHGENQIKHRSLIRNNAWAAYNEAQRQFIFNITVIHKNHITGEDAGLAGLPIIPLQQAAPLHYQPAYAGRSPGGLSANSPNIDP